MTSIFKNTSYFTILFLSILTIDIVVKLYFEVFPYRFVSKAQVISSLLVFYLINQHELTKKRFLFMSLALSCFFLGDFFLILYKNTALYIIGMLCFIFGKLFYVFRFSNQKDFNMIRLFPFLALCFIYMFILMKLVYSNLSVFFIPVLIYLFSSLLVALFAFLRKDAVSYKSYVLVIIGIFFAVLSDSIGVLQSFYNENLAYHEITIMLFYGLSQYFIVVGIVEENKVLIIQEVN